jgi:hypothetical protein
VRLVGLPLSILLVVVVSAALAEPRASRRHARAAIQAPVGADVAHDVRTHAERTRFEETSRYDDVRRVLDAVRDAAPALARIEAFGASEEGRDLPLAVIGNPVPPSAATARAARKPRVLVLGGIHGGEVEGKEAALILARRLAGGDLRRLLDRITVLVAPLYNADGNERVSQENRPEQHGPIGGVGIRTNARGADLNRDFMKLQTAEGRSLAALLATWDPHVVIDLHTTNGSYHGYHLTYAPTLAVNADPRLVQVSRTLLADTRRLLLDRGWRTYSYGNFVAEDALDRERHRPDAGAPAWRTFDARPRFVTNGVGLRNRIALLAEAYSYLGFDRRVRVTEAFVETLLALIARRAPAISSLLTRLDIDTVDAARRGALPPFGTRGRLAPLDGAVPILVGDVESRPNPRTGKPMTVMKESVATPVLMQDYASFEPVDLVTAPAAYILPPPVARTLEPLLERHGISVERLTAEARLDVERVVPAEVSYGGTTVQGRRQVKLGAVDRDRATINVPAGSLRVRLAQPLARLVFHLLEPTSDDGVVIWDLIPVRAGEAIEIFRER